MFYKQNLIALLSLLAFGLSGCTKRPNEMRVNSDFDDLGKMLSGLDNTYQNCTFLRESLNPIKEQGKDEGWQLFEMNVKIICGSKIEREKVRISYEYVIDFKDHAGPYWALASYGYDRPFPGKHDK